MSKQSSKSLLIKYEDGVNSIYDVIKSPAKDAFGREGKGEQIDVRYSPLDSSWSSHCRGQKTLSLHNDGNGITLTTKLGNFRLTYIDLETLALALPELESSMSTNNSANNFEVFEVTKVSNGVHKSK